MFCGFWEHQKIRYWENKLFWLFLLNFAAFSMKNHIFTHERKINCYVPLHNRLHLVQRPIIIATKLKAESPIGRQRRQSDQLEIKTKKGWAFWVRFPKFALFRGIQPEHEKPHLMQSPSTVKFSYAFFPQKKPNANDDAKNNVSTDTHWIIMLSLKVSTHSVCWHYTYLFAVLHNRVSSFKNNYNI